MDTSLRLLGSANLVSESHRTPHSEDDKARRFGGGFNLGVELETPWSEGTISASAQASGWHHEDSTAPIGEPRSPEFSFALQGHTRMSFDHLSKIARPFVEIHGQYRNRQLPSTATQMLKINDWDIVRQGLHTTAQHSDQNTVGANIGVTLMPGSAATLEFRTGLSYDLAMPDLLAAGGGCFAKGKIGQRESIRLDLEIMSLFPTSENSSAVTGKQFNAELALDLSVTERITMSLFGTISGTSLSIGHLNRSRDEYRGGLQFAYALMGAE